MYITEFYRRSDFHVLMNLFKIYLLNSSKKNIGSKTSEWEGNFNRNFLAAIWLTRFHVVYIIWTNSLHTACRSPERNSNAVCKKLVSDYSCTRRRTTLTLRSHVFWHVTPCGLVHRYQNFGETDFVFYPQNGGSGFLGDLGTCLVDYGTCLVDYVTCLVDYGTCLVD
jgi:hypothetical protein